MTRLPRLVFLVTGLFLLVAFAGFQLGSAGDKKDKDAPKDKKEVKDKDVKDKGAKDKDAKDKKTEVKDKEPVKEKEDKTPKKEPFKVDAALKEFKGHTDSVEALAYSSDGKWLASASKDRTVKVWDVESGKEITLKGHPREVKGVAILPGGFKVVVITGSWDKKKAVFQGEVRIWDAKAGKVEKTFTAHEAPIEALAITKDGKFLATGSEDQTAIIWDLASGKSLQTLKGHTGSIMSLAFSGDGKKIATTSADLTVRVWSTGDGKLLETLAKAEEPKKGPEPVKDKKDVVKDKKDVAKDKKDVAKDKKVAGKDKKDKGKETKVDTKPLPRPYTSVAFSADGSKVAAGNLEGIIRIWDANSGKELHLLKGHEGVWAVAFSPDGSKLATGGWDQRIKIWDVASGKEAQSINAHNHTVTALVFHPTEPKLASGGFDGMVKIWAIGAKK